MRQKLLSQKPKPDEYGSFYKGYVKEVDETLAKKGTVNGNTCSVRAIGFIIAGHERHHISILQDRYLERA